MLSVESANTDCVSSLSTWRHPAGGEDVRPAAEARGQGK